MKKQAFLPFETVKETNYRMTAANHKHLSSWQTLQVFRAQYFFVTDGANLGDALMRASELALDDRYHLSPDAPKERLTITSQNRAKSNCDFVVAESSELGLPGSFLILDSVATFMAPDGETLSAIILLETNPSDDAVTQIYLHPINDLRPKTDYCLIGVDTSNVKTLFAEVACVSFGRGTRITLASGEQCPIENLRIGDKVLTRDDGPQTVRWIGQNTIRAVGEFAPIFIKKGALNNENNLLVSHNHRLFVYQRCDEIGLGRSEVLVQARHLVNGTTIYEQEGGFIDYFQILFDTHQIIYAEGIAAESLLLDTRTAAVLPEGLAERLAHALGQHRSSPHLGYEVDKAMLVGHDPAEILRRASSA
ncbi:Hint domain-containing protein [Pseudohalocynthiibacter aestuariivivens]|uniref:Hint domain-containing protein n=1 Tax=Pseudohalocynthiibacter aestuariivivens TaxID=1591409 RepID=A0ABV5JJ21_9RHOB|nr:Hint domain-containing protein [Pseudohalocynthiibacter sp. F2068]